MKRIKHYTVDQNRLKELIQDKPNIRLEGTQTITESSTKFQPITKNSSRISQFQQHMIQEGIKQMLFGEGPVHYSITGSNKETECERDLTEPMKQMLLDFNVIVPKESPKSIISAICEAFNIHLVKENEFYFINGKVEYESTLEKLGINFENEEKIELEKSSLKTAMIKFRNDAFTYFVKDYIDKDGNCYIQELRIK